MPGSTHIRWSTHSRSSSSSSNSSSAHDEHSEPSASTAPTVHSTRPSERRYQRASDAYSKDFEEMPTYAYFEDAPASTIGEMPTYAYFDDAPASTERTSVETYASSSHSLEKLEDDLPPFDVPDFESETGMPSALASSPSEFADYFPSTHKISIKHDDSTSDGNMNLRVDTLAQLSDGTKADLTLFHLRMHNLKLREFSLRRHCRDSGREICHSTRKYQKPSIIRRPALQKSMSNAISGLRPRSADGQTTRASFKTQDSGYDSLDERKMQASSSPRFSPQASSIPRPTNTTLLDFSNYSHLEVKRRGARSSKRYEFQYWGTSYAWKRVSTTSGDYKEISYHLVETRGSASVAHIVPVPLSRSEAQEEEAKGGYGLLSHSALGHRLTIHSWVPPCSMWISDENILKRSLDVAE